MRFSKLTVAVLTAGAALGIAAGVQAAIPDASGVIQGCYDTSNGNLRVVDSSSSKCRNSETALNWNQTGPAGAPGPAGPQGPAGAQGPQGPPGPGTETIAGVVGSSGQIIEGSGFLVNFGGQFGNYRIGFPPGTWSSCQSESGSPPVVLVTPEVIAGPRIAPEVQSFCDGGGAADVHVLLLGGDDGTLIGDAFHFVAVQP